MYFLVKFKITQPHNNIYEKDSIRLVRAVTQEKAKEKLLRYFAFDIENGTEIDDIEVFDTMF